jgi:chorismate-pyruvate lyase
MYPLDDFYGAARLALPKHSTIDGAAMLEPYRSLLVHNGDMTPTLERHYRQSIHIQLLQCHRKRSGYFREVVLRLDDNQRPVEFGAIKINLELFEEAARKEIIAGVLPLGGIMRKYQVVHLSAPKAYLQLRSDGLINEALELPKSMQLYGRRNTLTTLSGEALAEIVEILAPAL